MPARDRESVRRIGTANVETPCPVCRSRPNRFPTKNATAIEGRKGERGSSFETVHTAVSGSPSCTSVGYRTRHLQNGRRTCGDRPACGDSDRLGMSSAGASPIQYNTKPRVCMCVKSFLRVVRIELRTSLSCRPSHNPTHTKLVQRSRPPFPPC